MISNDEIIEELRKQLTSYEHTINVLTKAISEQESCEDANANQHNSNALNDVGQRINALEDDAISRKAVLDAIEDDNRNGHYSCFASNNDAQCFKGVIGELPSVNPQGPKKKMTKSELIDFLSKQFDISRTSAKEMLHLMMSVKRKDNFKKQFSGRKER